MRDERYGATNRLAVSLEPGRTGYTYIRDPLLTCTLALNDCKDYRAAQKLMTSFFNNVTQRRINS